MKKTLFLFLTSIIFIANSFGQLSFQKAIGGSINEQGTCIQQTSDSGYIMVGYTMTFGTGGQDVYLIKTDNIGNILWTKTFGSFSNDYGSFVRQTLDGGYIITGTTSFGTGGKDIYLIKTTANGTMSWSRSIGGFSDDYGNCVEQTTDGGYIIGGIISGGSGGGCLIKTNSFGDTLWTRVFNNTAVNSVKQTIDGGFIATGGNTNIFLIKTDSSGMVLWSKNYGGTSQDDGNGVMQTSDGGYIVVGTTWSFGAGNSDAYLLKTDSLGNILWSKTYGGTSQERGNFIQKTLDGNYVVAGMSQTNATGSSYFTYLFKVDALGDTLWTKSYHTAIWDVYSYSVDACVDSGFAVTGAIYSSGSGGYDTYLIKTNKFGLSGCNDNFTQTTITSPITQVYTQTTTFSTGGSIVTPATIVGSGGVLTNICTTVDVNENYPNRNSISIYPNPSRKNFVIELNQEMKNALIEVFNSLGDKVYSEHFSGNTVTIENNLSEGIYFVHVKYNELIWTGRMVKE